MNLVNFVTRGALLRARFHKCGSPAAPEPATDPQIATQPAACRSHLFAIWQVNPQTGRIECQWKSISEETELCWSASSFERFGMILALTQQARGSISGRLQ